MKTLEDYHKLLRDRPEKLSGKEAGYMPESDKEEHQCGKCTHWYNGPAAGRSVCEVTYGEDKEIRNIPVEATCDFWTSDGKTFPRLPKQSKSAKKEQKQPWETLP